MLVLVGASGDGRGAGITAGARGIERVACEIDTNAEELRRYLLSQRGSDGAAQWVLTLRRRRGRRLQAARDVSVVLAAPSRR